MMPSAPPTATWVPILEGEDAARAAEAVAAVAGALGAEPLAGGSGTAPLSMGEAGCALLFEYLDRAQPGGEAGKVAVRRLERAIDDLATSSRPPSLYSGFTGVAWVVEQIQGGAPEDDSNADIDQALLRHLRQSPWTRSFDLTSGLVGYGVFALERLPRPAAAEALGRIVDLLGETAQPRPAGLAWHTAADLLPAPTRAEYPKGYDNLGMAHGTPGVIALLARIARSGAAGVAAERARLLLEGAVSWLLTQKLPEGGAAVYPYAVGEEVPVRPARAAWCYGDPGIAAALLAAARALGRADWEREAVKLALASARRTVASCRIDDAGLCHGAAGLGHLFNRLHQATGEAELLAAARAWLARALDYRRPGEGVGGFFAWSPAADDPDEMVWTADPGFLSGAAGTALALLAATTAVEPAWDRLLLLSPLDGR